MVQLPDDLVVLADRRARREGISRSQLLRDALRAYLGHDERDDIARAYGAAYVSQPYGTPDEWGDLEGFHAALARERAGKGRPKTRRKR